jgi:hypothetical protein
MQFADHYRPVARPLTHMGYVIDPHHWYAKALRSCWLPNGLLAKDVCGGWDMIVPYGTVTYTPQAAGMCTTVSGDNGLKSTSGITELATEAGGGCVIWFMATALPGADRSIVVKVNGSNGLTFYVKSTNVLAINLNPTAGGTATNLVGTTTLSTMKLYCASASWVSGGVSSIYLNGVREATTGATATFDTGSVPVWMPGEAFGGLPLSGYFFRLDWFKRPLSDTEHAAVAAAGPLFGLKGRRIQGINLKALTFSDVHADWADNFSLSSAAPEGDPNFPDTLTLSDNIFPQTVTNSWADSFALADAESDGTGISRSVADTLSLSDLMDTIPSWSDTLTFGDTNAFLPATTFGDWSDTLLLSGRLRANSGVLASGTYRR